MGPAGDRRHPWSHPVAIIIPFPTAPRRPGLRELRARLGPLSADELRGLHALGDGLATGEPDGIAAEVLSDHLAAEVDAATWKAWLRAYGRLQALP